MTESKLRDASEPEPDSPSRHGYWGPLPGESVALYEHLGVRYVYDNLQPHFPRALRSDFDLTQGKIIKADFHGNELPRPTPPRSLTRREQTESMVRFTKKNELIHLGGLAIMGVIGGMIISQGGPIADSIGALFESINVPYNIYPIMLQRYLRLRGYRILDSLRKFDSLPQNPD